MKPPRIMIDREPKGWHWTLVALSWKGNWNEVQRHETRFYVVAVAQAWLARRRWS